MKSVTVVACTFFLVFVSARAVRVPFTYDEAASYIRYIDTSVPSVFDTNLLSIFNFEVATNHLLNTALTKLSYMVGGGSELVLRLPSLLGYALYISFAALILRRVSNPLIGVGGLLLVNLNPYLLDFFGLSRGYGLSLGLMMGALFFLLRFLDALAAGAIDSLDLSRTLTFVCAAVAANFTLLNVYASMFAAVVIAAWLFNNRAESLADSHRDMNAGARGRRFPWLPLTAVIFIPLVFSQDTGLSEALYQPVVVRLAGVDGTALDRARVVRLDIHGRESALRKDADSPEWSSRGRSHYRGLRIELPRESADTLTRIEAVIGTRAFSFDPRLTTNWIVRDEGGLRAFESGPDLSLPRSRITTFRSVINWSGDRVQALQVGMASALVWAILSLLALVLRLLDPVIVGAKMMDRRKWRALSSSVVWVGVFAGTPLYLLKRNGELYFGGRRGLVEDTFTSVIEGSFYGRNYSNGEVAVVFGCIGAVLAIFSAVLVIAYRRRLLSTAAPAISLLGILALVSVSLVVQRFLFGTVYLIGRTALLYIPLFVLFFAFVCDGLAQAGRLARALAASIMIAALGLASFHFAQTANLKYVHDWKHDASTKAMIDDVGQFVSGGPVSLGVAPTFAPVVIYYARRAALPIEVVVGPTNHPVDFLYLEDRDVHSGDIVSRYPLTQTALVRVAR